MTLQPYVSFTTRRNTHICNCAQQHIMTRYHPSRAERRNTCQTHLLNMLRNRLFKLQAAIHKVNVLRYRVLTRFRLSSEIIHANNWSLRSSIRKVKAFKVDSEVRAKSINTQQLLRTRLLPISPCESRLYRKRTVVSTCICASCEPINTQSQRDLHCAFTTH